MSSTSHHAASASSPRYRRVTTALLAMLATLTLGGSLSPPLAATPSPGPRAYGTWSDRPTTYDRYREEQHRRKVEKELRDIKRNTQRQRGDPLR
jgi:hypothetical protein